MTQSNSSIDSLSLEFLGEQLLRADAHDLVFRLENLANKPAMLERSVQRHGQALEGVAARLMIDPSLAAIAKNGLARHQYAGLRFAGQRKKTSDGHAGSEARRIGRNQQEE